MKLSNFNLLETLTHIIRSEKVFIMKRLLLILILTLSFQSLTRADDISDFEIEGMSIGDSLLDYMDKNLITKAINSEFSYYYKKDFVSISTWDIRDKFTIYDDVGVVLGLTDKKYKIFALEGTLYFKDNNIDKCYKKQNEISNNIKKSLNLNIKEDTFFVPKDNLRSHHLSVKYIDFELSGGGVIRTTCYEIKKGIQKNSDYNLLYVIVNSPSFWKYLEKNN